MATKEKTKAPESVLQTIRLSAADLATLNEIAASTDRTRNYVMAKALHELCEAFRAGQV